MRYKRNKHRHEQFKKTQKRDKQGTELFRKSVYRNRLFAYPGGSITTVGSLDPVGRPTIVLTRSSFSFTTLPAPCQKVKIDMILKHGKA